jgi:hypothetical protein
MGTRRQLPPFPPKVSADQAQQRFPAPNFDSMATTLTNDVHGDHPCDGSNRMGLG